MTGRTNSDISTVLQQQPDHIWVLLGCCPHQCRLSPRLFLSGLVQYNSRSDALSGNFRLRWEWAPGSELFLAYTEERFTETLDRWGVLQNRGLVIKVNRLLTF